MDSQNNEPEKGIKIEYFTIDPSNPYGPQPGHIFSDIKKLCEKYTVVDIKYIEHPKEGITYAVVMYKE